MKKMAFLLAALGALLFCDTSWAQDGYKIILHRSNSTSSMTKDEVSRLFLKKVSKWSDGQKVQPVDLPAGSSARSSFSKDVLRKSVNAVKVYWQQEVFSGRAIPPPEKASVREVVAFVQANPGAVGYVPSNTSVGECKVLEIR